MVFHSGISRCDARRSLTETKQQFPGVDFSRIQSEEDTMYPRFCQQNGGGFGGEPEDNVTNRGLAFLSWLMKRYMHHVLASVRFTCWPTEYAILSVFTVKSPAKRDVY